ncbi:Response regulator protein VraR [Sporomusa ovata DSM 2662]|uniref:Two-component response regulator n=1 Tax=Sporomusa ovata TaxID=2378 RepID=A0A0U1KYY7_9FIRM|nr:response regulator transcription factor [Sporomusa ovata]EQB29191.1 two component transcriptional regulator, LuxR family [Sporomusa ovata DSM 2662]CQR72627.1 two-component response regulator [Sporomusa ovata]
MGKPRILLVDDHALFLEGLRSFFMCNGISVIGTARSGPEALLKYEMLRPDIVLMDIQMLQSNGIEATQAMKKEYPEAVIIMLTSDEAEESIFEALQAGASGYLTKTMEPEELLEQLARSAEGEMPMAPGLAGRMLNLFSYRQSQEGEEFLQALTKRQVDILTMLTLGYKYKEIASKMEIKEGTVKYHIREIMDKLHVCSRAQIIDYVSKQSQLHRNCNK